MTAVDWLFYRRTRWLTLATTILLSIQLSGNLYEEIVPNAQLIANPIPGAAVGELDAGSPLYFYLPWVPIGIVLLVILSTRAWREASPWIARRHLAACGSVVIAIIAKAYAIGWLNPINRDDAATPQTVRDNAILWAFVNGTAAIAIAVALVLLLGWRFRATGESSVQSARAASPDLVAASRP